ncbi:hypothetical protein DEU42_10869 [Flavobacterium sp. AG291]|nr:hypothetical protein DEU42_10869 [Flavobacterium sp. AG291]
MGTLKAFSIHPPLSIINKNFIFDRLVFSYYQADFILKSIYRTEIVQTSITINPYELNINSIGIY